MTWEIATSWVWRLNTLWKKGTYFERPVMRRERKRVVRPRNMRLLRWRGHGRHLCKCISKLEPCTNKHLRLYKYFEWSYMQSRKWINADPTILCMTYRAVPVELPNALYLGQLSQLQPLLDSINAVRKCTTPYCRGKSYRNAYQKIKLQYLALLLSEMFELKIGCKG